MIERAGHGGRRQMPQIIHRLAQPYKSPERQMKSSSGWYTLFADHWCWIYKRKGRYQALIEGIHGETDWCDSMMHLGLAIRRKLNDRDKKDKR